MVILDFYVGTVIGLLIGILIKASCSLPKMSKIKKRRF